MSGGTKNEVSTPKDNNKKEKKYPIPKFKIKADIKTRRRSTNIRVDSSGWDIPTYRLGLEKRRKNNEEEKRRRW